jgi:hypothetical protein
MTYVDMVFRGTLLQILLKSTEFCAKVLRNGQHISRAVIAFAIIIYVPLTIIFF